MWARIGPGPRFPVPEMWKWHQHHLQYTCKYAKYSDYQIRHFHIVFRFIPYCFAIFWNTSQAREPGPSATFILFPSFWSYNFHDFVDAWSVGNDNNTYKSMVNDNVRRVLNALAYLRFQLKTARPIPTAREGLLRCYGFISVWTCFVLVWAENILAYAISTTTYADTLCAQPMRAHKHEWRTNLQMNSMARTQCHKKNPPTLSHAIVHSWAN